MVATVDPGLTGAEAAARLATDGPNELPVVVGLPVWRHLVAQFVHFFALMLWVAAALALVADLVALAAAIVVVVMVNGLFSFAQEARAERATARLRDLLPRRCRVVRDGRSQEIDAADLVRGDLVVLGAGDRVSADLTLRDAHGLAVDTSLVTGESVPARLDAGAELPAGCFVVEGEAHAVVVATGGRTRLAGIARLTSAEARPKGTLARELDRVVRVIATIAIGLGATFFVIALLVGSSLRNGVIFAIGVTVALVPEGLLPTVTLSLALGAQRMSTRRALVRRLESVESLGATTFVCTDKTGTLTQNVMTVVEVWTPMGSAQVAGAGYGPDAEVTGSVPAVRAAGHLAAVAARASSGHVELRGGRWVAIGDPMEAALDALAVRMHATHVAGVEQARFPFDTRRRRMSVVVDGVALLKGAPDSVLGIARDPDAAASAALADFAARGLRVLAVAERPGIGASATRDEVECDVTLLGLIGIEDPPREDVEPAIRSCRRAGIAVAMVTGDHPDTALAIAREVGLATEPPHVLVGADLPADDDALGRAVDVDGVVIARVTPEDKLRIAHALQQRGHVVAMTGDGVNDGPALHAADIGVAMGESGTDVAREAADLVLLDDHFATIVSAIEQGRATFANVRRFLTYHLTDNVAELTPFAVWALSGGRIPLALTVLAVLCLDIGTDLLPALALGAESPGARVLEGLPRTTRLVDRPLLGRVFLVLGPAEAVVEMLAFGATFVAVGWRPGESFPGGPLAAASGAAFAAVVLGQMANAFACRSGTKWPGALGWGTNRLLVGAVVVEGVTLLLFLFVGPVADQLRVAPPTAVGWLVALLAVPAVLGVDATAKHLHARRRPRARPGFREVGP